MRLPPVRGIFGLSGRKRECISLQGTSVTRCVETIKKRRANALGGHMAWYQPPVAAVARQGFERVRWGVCGMRHPVQGDDGEKPCAYSHCKLLQSPRA